MQTRKIPFVAGGLALAFSVLSCGDGDSASKNTPPVATSAPTEQQIDGQQLFVQNCAACHQKDRDAVGPALRGVRARWENNNKRLYAYIRNNVEVTASGDPRAVQVQQKWGGAMPLFDGFSDEQIEAILQWVEM
jgi:mono/diheme cytochrome c family protein